MSASPTAVPTAFGSTAAPRPARMPVRAPPQYQLHKDRNTSSIKIDKWTITATKKPILNIQEVESWEKSLGLPLPEMTFGNNSLELSYEGSSSGSTSRLTPSKASQSGSAASAPEYDAQAGTSAAPSGVRLRFHAYDALAAVGVGEGWEERVGGGVRVSMADKWGKNRHVIPILIAEGRGADGSSSNPSALLTDVPLPTTPVKPHDWTFSSTHTGSTSGSCSFEPSATHEIPLALLARQDPILDQILFYEDVPLFEDELHDNGESILNARIRVMPHAFFILARLFLRVDNVLFRMYDVRIYHSFGSEEVIREVNGMEAEYDDVKAMLEKQSDLSPLTDPNFVSRAMTHLASRPDEGIDSRRLRPGKPWPGLGKKVEVLRLASEVDEAGEKLGKMGI